MWLLQIGNSVIQLIITTSTTEQYKIKNKNDSNFTNNATKYSKWFKIKLKILMAHFDIVIEN